MSINTLEAAITPRKGVESYNVQINQSTMDILSLFFEFKLATSWQIARFLGQKDQSRYIYLKLRRMWRAQLLESIKVYSGSPLYYVLSQKGLKTLEERGVYERQNIQNYPLIKTLMSWTLFQHESQIVELASREAKNTSDQFKISFRGELTSGSSEARSDKNVEVFTPDYTAIYAVKEKDFYIYSEFERTAKAHEAMARKIDRYLLYLSPEQRARSALRIIFQTPEMEQSFWLNVFNLSPSVLQKIRIVTTHLGLLGDQMQFLEPVYATGDSAQITKEKRIIMDASRRIKLFSFM